MVRARTAGSLNAVQTRSTGALSTLVPEIFIGCPCEHQGPTSVTTPGRSSCPVQYIFADPLRHRPPRRAAVTHDTGGGDESERRGVPSGRWVARPLSDIGLATRDIPGHEPRRRPGMSPSACR